jgi:hypothetical protein
MQIFHSKKLRQYDYFESYAVMAVLTRTTPQYRINQVAWDSAAQTHRSDREDLARFPSAARRTEMHAPCP